KSDLPDYERDLAQTHNNLAILLKDLGKPAEAEAAYREALPIAQRLAIQFPSSMEYQSDLAAVLGNLAEILNDQKRYDAARPLLERALPLHHAVLEANPKNPQ